jgi:hypothetical protein
MNCYEYSPTGKYFPEKTKVFPAGGLAVVPLNNEYPPTGKYLLCEYSDNFSYQNILL